MPRVWQERRSNRPAPEAEKLPFEVGNRGGTPLPVRRAAGRAGLGDGSPPALAAGQKLFGEGQTPVAGKRFKRV